MEQSLAKAALFQDVQQIEASYGAFAAILADGSVVTWGDIDTGGDCSKVKHKLKGRSSVILFWGMEMVGALGCSTCRCFLPKAFPILNQHGFGIVTLLNMLDV